MLDIIDSINAITVLNIISSTIMQTQKLSAIDVSVEEKAFEKEFFANWTKGELEQAIQDGIDSGSSTLDTSEKFKEYFFNKYKNA